MWPAPGMKPGSDPLKTLYFAYPGDLDTPTGGYGYDRRIIAGLEELGWDVHPLSLGGGFPFPAEADLVQAQAVLDLVPDGALLTIDGLAFGVFDMIAEALAQRLTLVALVHHPLCQETGLTLQRAESLRVRENCALGFAHHIIVTSPATADQVKDLFEVPDGKIGVVLPGTDKPAPFPHSPGPAVQLLSVGTLVPRKGYDLLLSALAELKDLDWHLDIVGGKEADPDCAARLQAETDKLGLGDRVTFHGAVPSASLLDFYRKADLFVLASRYEGYGMAYTEAIAHGLPVIGSGAGAVEETLPPDAALYCGTEDTDRLRQALALLIGNKDQRTNMAEAAWKAAAALPDWKAAAGRFAAALEEAHQ